jgi:hypothetical protein
MSTPQIRKPRKKPTVRLGGLNDIRIGTPAHALFSTQGVARPHPPKPSVPDYTFEQYKAANPDIRDQHSLIGKLRGEIPIIDRDEVDDALLQSMAQQLELCIFPTCKMMQVDPAAVKRMLDEQFRRSYGLKVEAEVLKKLGLCRLEDVVRAPAVQGEAVTVDWDEMTVEKAAGNKHSITEEPEKPGAVTTTSENTKTAPTDKGNTTDEITEVANTLMGLREFVAVPPPTKKTKVTPAEENATPNKATQVKDNMWEEIKAPTPAARPNKKMKAAPLNDTQREIKTHITKRKRARRGVKMVTLRSQAASEKWEALNGAS